MFLLNPNSLNNEFDLYNANIEILYAFAILFLLHSLLDSIVSHDRQPNFLYFTLNKA